jgi:hypothetical protein
VVHGERKKKKHRRFCPSIGSAGLQLLYPYLYAFAHFLAFSLFNLQAGRHTSDEVGLDVLRMRTGTNVEKVDMHPKILHA